MIDVFPDANGMVGPEQPPLPKGPSTFADLAYAPLTGHWHELPRGTPLPQGLAVVADGQDIVPHGPHPVLHYTIYPSIQMHVDQFIELYLNLPWSYGGRRK